MTCAVRESVISAATRENSSLAEKKDGRIGRCFCFVESSVRLWHLQLNTFETRVSVQWGPIYLHSPCGHQFTEQRGRNSGRDPWMAHGDSPPGDDISE